MYLKTLFKNILPYGVVCWVQRLKNKTTIPDKHRFALDAFWDAQLKEDICHSFDFLSTNSVVFDIGGYQGEWSKIISAKYNTNIFIFEPVLQFYEQIQKFFKNNPKIHPYNFGFSDTSQTTTFSLEQDASSSFKTSKNTTTVTLQCFSDFISKNSFSQIELTKINIEGAEYELIKDMFEHSLLVNINYILVQFHDFVDNADVKIDEAHKQLSQTHTQLWGFPFVWELWKKTKE